MNDRYNTIRETVRARILEVRFDAEGRLLNRPVRAAGGVKPVRRHASRSAAEAVQKLRREANAQIRTLKVLGFAASFAIAAIGLLTVAAASGAAPKIQQGFAVITQLVEGFLS